MNEFSEVAPFMPDPFRILWREKVSSTNDELQKLAESGMGEGLILISEEQTAGRGRRGAEWFCGKGDGLAFSVLLKPVAAKAFWYRLALTAGLAVAEALESYVPLAEIKWPNDVLVNNKKIAGILVEAGSSYVVLGIGINVNTMNFPDGLNATSLGKESGNQVSRADVLLKIVQRLGNYVNRIESDFESILEGIRERCAMVDCEVTMKSAGNQKNGILRGIGNEGELLLDVKGKIERIYQADELRLVEI
ncbi:biotin--[acetyl-CoA-carboxylase] ligase [Luteolibacter sp. AS25]|uniref:biotin--[acetyl-CoA-carboxylase] ligase n=1 Tax=Luteolibacter sp. AS25 TaxID=3135776 RepID=UPI00398AB6A4